MTKYKKFDEKTWRGFGKSLLKEKGSEKQKEFLKICKSGKADFLNYISNESNIIEGETVKFTYQFSEAEFRNPPKDTQKIIWNKFKDVPIEEKCSFGFWGYTIISMIEDNLIKPDYLSSGLNGVTKTGVYVIDQALGSQSNNLGPIDVCVRRILRSMCNPAARGKRILFNDFYLGRAYWRWHWSQKMSEFISLEFEEILEILDEDYYPIFAAKMHTGKSYIGSKKVLGGLLLYLKKLKNKQKMTSKNLGEIIDRISYLSIWKAIEIQCPKDNQKEIQEISNDILQ